VAERLPARLARCAARRLRDAPEPGAASARLLQIAFPAWGGREPRACAHKLACRAPLLAERPEAAKPDCPDAWAVAPDATTDRPDALDIRLVAEHPDAQERPERLGEA
jgi:hypothetical protein